MPQRRDLMQQAIQMAREWMPDQANVPMMPVDKSGETPRTPNGRVLAEAHNNRIEYDADAINELGDPQYAANILVHELAHMRQPRTQSVWDALKEKIVGPKFAYGQDPEELEAFAAGNDRALATHSRPIVPPSFWGGPKTFTDIELPPDKPKRRSPK